MGYNGDGSGWTVQAEGPRLRKRPLQHDDAHCDTGTVDLSDGLPAGFTGLLDLRQHALEVVVGVALSQRIIA